MRAILSRIAGRDASVGVGGEHRSEFGATNQLGDLVWSDAPLDQCWDGFFELVGYVWGSRVEVLDPVNLFGHVGQVEVHRKGSDEQVGLSRVGIVEQRGQPPGHRVVGFEGAEVSGERSDPFDCVEQLWSVLTNEGVAQLVAEPPYVGA